MGLFLVIKNAVQNKKNALWEMSLILSDLTSGPDDGKECNFLLLVWEKMISAFNFWFSLVS